MCREGGGQERPRRLTEEQCLELCVEVGGTEGKEGVKVLDNYEN